VSRFVHSTQWPTILSTDTAATQGSGVRGSIIWINYLAAFTSICLAVAGVLSPIGLDERIAEADVVNATFQYAMDSSIFVNGTISRQNYALFRSCGGKYQSKPCPGNVQPLNMNNTNQSLSITPTQSLIPGNISSLFSSGTRKATDLRAGPFDIQYRQFLRLSMNESVPTEYYSTYTYLGPVIMEPTYQLKEGVIIDPKNGGIGFRNHSVPKIPTRAQSAVWTEEILWISPITSCIQTNWTIYMSVNLALSPLTVSTIQMVRNGTSPIPPEPQGDLRLDTRLYAAARAWDYDIMEYYSKPNARNATVDNSNGYPSITLRSGDSASDDPIGILTLVPGLTSYLGFEDEQTPEAFRGNNKLTRFKPLARPCE
jgi:hypothetical protein